MKPKKTVTLTAIALAVVGTLVLIAWRGASAEAVYPIERGRMIFVRKAWVRVKGFFNGASAAAENVRLKREVAALALVRTDCERLEAENMRLRKALEYRDRKREKWLAAAILSRGGGAAGFGDIANVDKGSLDGVSEGAIVVVPEGLVGRVISVSPHTSKIRLLSDAALKVACEIETADGAVTRGIIAGGDGDILLMRHLTNAGASIPPRSRVLTSGLGGIFPRGIEIGTLLVVKNLAREVVGEVLPSVDYSALEDVFIRCAK